jgi:hypothetical protein
MISNLNTMFTHTFCKKAKEWQRIGETIINLKARIKRMKDEHLL